VIEVLIFATMQRGLVVIGGRASGGLAILVVGARTCAAQRRPLRILRIGEATLVFDASKACLYVVEL